MMGDAPDEQLLNRIEAALGSAGRQPAFPETVILPDAIAEVRRWLADERQWHHAQAANWKSLVDDLRRAALAYPDRVLVHAGDPGDLRDELDLCVTERCRRSGS